MSGMIMSGRRRIVAAVGGVAVLVVVAVGALVGLRGNDSTDGAQPVVTPTTSAPVVTPTPTPTPTIVVPELPDAAKKRNQKGAEAFFRYFIDVYNYSFQSLDASAMEQVTESECKFCASVVTDVNLAKDRGLRYEGSSLKLAFVAASPGVPEDGLLIVAVMDQSVGSTIGRDGKVSQKHAAKKDIRVDAGVRWSAGQWRVFGVKLPDVK